MFLRLGTDGRYSVTNGKILLRIFVYFVEVLVRFLVHFLDFYFEFNNHNILKTKQRETFL